MNIFLEQLDLKKRYNCFVQLFSQKSLIVPDRSKDAFHARFRTIIAISSPCISGIAKQIGETCIFRAATRCAKSRHDENRRGEEWTRHTTSSLVIAVSFLVLTRKEQLETFVFLLLHTGVTIIIVA